MARHRLNWGCGPVRPRDWVNSDVEDGDGVDLPCDIRQGLAVADDTFDSVVSIHVLEQLPYLELDAALRELRRVLKPGGTLRLAVPDLDRALAAYRDRNPHYFYVPDRDVASVGGKLCVQMTWYGSSRSLFTYDFLEELLARTGFREVRRCAFGETASDDPQIVTLDNRERESLIVEAIK